MSDADLDTSLLPQLVRQRGSSSPDAVFMQEAEGASTTYGEMQTRVERWARHLHALGVGRGDHVVTMFDLGPEAFAAWLALAWVGAVDVTVNTAYKGELLSHVVASSGATFGVAPPERKELLAAALTEASSSPGPGITVLTPESLDAAGPPKAPVELGDGPGIADIACVVFTSGTTGPSKGVRVPWGQMLGLSTFIGGGAPVHESVPIYTFLPTFHVSGRAGVWFAAACGGHSVYRSRFSISRFWPDVNTYGCRLTCLMGPMASMLMAAPPSPQDSTTPLRHVFLSPVAVEPAAFSTRFGVDLRTGYASTEIGPCFGTGWTIEDPRSCGRLLPGYSARLIAEDGGDVADGQTGELLVRHENPSMMNAGYLNLPDATAEAWRDGWFHTGDVFLRDNHGRFYFVDRLKDALRRRGENVSSFEVEALVNQHPGVAETAAVGVPAEHGEDDVKVFVVPVAGADLDPAILHAYLGETMPRHMVPRYIELISELPKTEASLRTQKAKLRSRGHGPSVWDAEAQSTVRSAVGGSSQ